MVAIWSPAAKIVAERRLWLAVLRAQRDLGIEVPDGVLDDYEAGARPGRPRVHRRSASG
jgi:adenylosuccinate lyase